jgi:hypothetical protein
MKKRYKVQIKATGGEYADCGMHFETVNAAEFFAKAVMLRWPDQTDSWRVLDLFQSTTEAADEFVVVKVGWH